jgi:hypothetical protein
LDAEQLHELAPRELRHRDHVPRSVEDVWDDPRAVDPRPAVERARVAEDREVVNRDDGRHGRAERAAVRRAVEDVGAAGAPRQPERVPERVPDECRRAAGSAERHAPHVDVVTPFELAQQAVEVARCPRRRLGEGRRVDRDPHSASA